MQNSTHMKLMPPVLDDLINDGRLERLFSKDARHCALQLWILQIKSENVIENRVVYGRLLPYSHSNDRWSASDDDNFHSVGRVEIQILRLNLYVKSVHCANLLRQLCAGRTVSELSEEFKFGLSDKLKVRLGATSLSANDLVYRPIAYLLNRDAHDRRSPSSPHGGAGAFSASITQVDKVGMFRLGQDYDSALAAIVVNLLNADTGLNFGNADTVRFGDLELLVFPALDDQERQLLTVSWSDSPRSLIIQFNPIQVPNFSGFQFRLSIENGSQIVYSGLAHAVRNGEGVFECKFELGNQLCEITDSAELDIFGFHGDDSREGTLCCRWRIGYVREIHIQGHVAGQGASPVKFDWLEKTTRPAVSTRVKAALIINRGNMGFANQIGGREADPWVPINRDFVSLFARLHPPKSEGQFFLRWGQEDGEGRLQFVEWFRALMAKYQQHQIVIFDPYFEAAGLGLVLLCAAPKADYIVFTTLPKPSKAGEAMQGESDQTSSGRVNNLVASCEHNRPLLQRIKLRIYGLKEGRLHDRYILIMGPDGLPITGFNLSNSFQKAAENYPLLVTPIPADVLLKVEQYQSGLVREAEATQPEGETENSTLRLLFDSTESSASSTAPRRYEPLRFLERAKAGDVLSALTSEPSLQHMSGDPLKVRMAALGLLKENSLALPEKASIRNCLDQQAADFVDFTATWEVLGEVLAHSRAEDRIRELESECVFLEFLARFLEASFNREHNEADKELAVVGARLFREPVETLLHSSYRPHHLFHATKYAALSWPEYFSIKILWSYAPSSLLAIAGAQALTTPLEPQAQDVIRLSLLSQMVSEISLSLEFGISEKQRDVLLLSNNGLLKWLGLNAVEQQLEDPEGPADMLKLVSTFTHLERVRALGWMINHTALNPNKTDIYKELVAALYCALPSIINAEELKLLVDSMRGHMRQLAWAEPWLFKDVVFPLLQNDRAIYDDACDIWMQELANMLEPQLKDQPLLFNQEREGQTTNITAFLFANSSPERQQATLKSIQAILKRQRRIVQQPLASTSDWRRWDRALTASLWILAFSKWVEYHLRQRSIVVPEVELLAHNSRELAMVRPVAEWRSTGTSNHGQLAALLDEVEGLLAQSDEPKGELA